MATKAVNQILPRTVGVPCLRVLHRHVSGVRRMLGEFIRSVHPDLTPEFPPEARRINQSSLSQLNAFVDKLEFNGTAPLEAGPEPGRELAFFRVRTTHIGRPISGRVIPLNLNLPALSVVASEMDREYVAARLIRDAELAIAAPSSAFTNKPQVPPIFTQKGSQNSAFKKLWGQQTQEAMVQEALYGPDNAEVRRHAAVKVYAQKVELQLLRKYQKINHNRRRKKKLASVDAKVQAKLDARFDEKPDLPEEMLLKHESEEQQRQERKDATRVLRAGFHPNLVFVAPDVVGDQKREAVRRMCGMNLDSDADFWLLENLWKAMRETPPQVPIVIATSGCKAHVETGFIQLPWNFTIAELCDVLEESLDDVREGLKRRREGADVTLSPPPPPQEPRLIREDDDDDCSDYENFFSDSSNSSDDEN